MNDLEKTTQNRIKIAKVGAVLLIIYSLCALIFFILNTLSVVDFFKLAEYETHRLMQLSSIGTCVLGIVTGILCLMKINSSDWYGIIYVFCSITVVFNVFVVLGHATHPNNIAATLIIFGCAALACVCAIPVCKLKRSVTEL